MMDNFFSGETLYYGYDIKDYKGAVVDIRADAVTLKLARWQGGAPELTAEADCLTFGESGRAVFLVPKETTSLAPNNYYYEITYTTGSALYVMESGIVKCLPRLGE